ncbi:MAG TPA: ABC transporter substrate-binding protein [Streptosporangiaceae bacterium]|jgi:peptide/nickel transport system substrate-binding protein|nr:ABC transporter substrate-binding protein [Streptosporangiaceae bacterium]
MNPRWRTSATAAVLAACALLAAGCGRSAGSAATSAGQISPTKGLVTSTAAGTKAMSSVTWAVYRPVNSLDPIFAFDYPENTAISLMCESLLLQEPSGSIQPGLATVSTPTPTSMVFTLRPGVTFWDGHAVTPADVVYSLQRQMNPAFGGFYGQVFDRVKSITATGTNQVTISLKQPDYWLEGELSSMPGIIVEKSYAQQQGKNYGTPGGGIMCTGPYELKSWTAGAGVTAVVNPHYWNTSVKPLVKQIVIKGVPSAASFTSGMLTGAIQGSYYFGLSNLKQLESSSSVKVYQGPGEMTDAFIVSATSGPLANVKVRQALSLALDRQAIISNVYDGAALMPRWLANPGTFGYGKSAFDAAYDSSPILSQDLTAAKKLAKEAGVAGQTITIGTSSEIASISAETGAYQQAAEAIGLKVVLKSVSAADFINFFTSAQARQGVDGFLTVNYGDYADPAALLATVALPGGDQNYDKFSNPQMTTLLNQARSTANPDQRAQLVAKAEELAGKLLPWIPNVQPTNVLMLSSNITGATASFSYMFAPWADDLGGKG